MSLILSNSVVSNYANDRFLELSNELEYSRNWNKFEILENMEIRVICENLISENKSFI